MRIKTFYTKTMSGALQEIKANLGPDALLLSTKEIARKSGVWGSSSGFEVVAAYDGSDDVDVLSLSHAYKTGDETLLSLRQGTDTGQSAEGVAETHLPDVAAKKHPAGSSAKSPKPKMSGGNADLDMPAATLPEKEFPFKGRVPLGLYRDLVDCGIADALAQDLLTRAWDSLTAGQRRSRAAWVRSITQAVLELVTLSATEEGMPEKKVVAFMGPTGVGKTTSIAKLAARLALEKKKKVLLVTLDGYRIGAIEQLRAYAGLMGIPFRFVDQVSELARVIEDSHPRDYILIDTAGRGPRDMESMQELAQFLQQSSVMERHLVLSAATKPADMRATMDQFEICRPDHLLFTKLDETSTRGPILNELVRTRKSFSYYTDGQRVPDDLHAVSRGQIIDIVLNRRENAPKDSL
jgi:flagellar biosynthesis protein FlhF